MGEITISGKIVFERNPPTDFVQGSIAHVKFEDCRRACAASINLGRVEIDAHAQFSETDKVIKYSLKCKKPDPATYSMSCVINVGWKASGNEWIRKGDYLSDTTHPIPITSANEYERDIAVVLYT